MNATVATFVNLVNTCLSSVILYALKSVTFSLFYVSKVSLYVEDVFC